MTQEHCAYCDCYPVEDATPGEIDHFQPKTSPQFYLQVCVWNNLFYACRKCNNNKGTQWNINLLRPDMENYQFLDYFLYETDSGKIVPNPRASKKQQTRAETTIAIFGFNDPSRCQSRRRLMKNLNLDCLPEEYDEHPYRYLIDLQLITEFE
jgi:uncharacterized protein (TIGR02646 family)